MIGYLIKNNIKLMLRSKTNILLFIFLPLMVMAILISAFNDLLEKYEKEEIYAGYIIRDENISEEMIDALIKAAEDNDIKLTEYNDTDPEKTVRDEDLTALVVFSEGKNTFYENEDHKMGARVFEYFIGAFFENMASSILGLDTSDMNIKIEHPSYTPSIDSTDYYGIVETVYFGWCAIVCGAGIFMSEKKHRIDKKYRVSNLSSLQLYLGKFLSLSTVVGASSLLTAVLSVLLLGVHWGKPILSALVILLSTFAAAAFGLFIYSLTDNLAATVIAVFAIVWVAGYFGGTFETYMLSAFSESIKLLSPIYHINRSLTELSIMGHSDYTKSAIVFCLGITVISSVFAVFTDSLRRRGRA